MTKRVDQLAKAGQVIEEYRAAWCAFNEKPFAGRMFYDRGWVVQDVYDGPFVRCTGRHRIREIQQFTENLRRAKILKEMRE
jgi:hypothetical protein